MLLVLDPLSPRFPFLSRLAEETMTAQGSRYLICRPRVDEANAVRLNSTESLDVRDQLLVEFLESLPVSLLQLNQSWIVQRNGVLLSVLSCAVGLRILADNIDSAFRCQQTGGDTSC